MNLDDIKADDIRPVVERYFAALGTITLRDYLNSGQGHSEVINGVFFGEWSQFHRGPVIHVLCDEVSREHGGSYWQNDQDPETVRFRSRVKTQADRLMGQYGVIKIRSEEAPMISTKSGGLSDFPSLPRIVPGYEEYGEIRAKMLGGSPYESVYTSEQWYNEACAFVREFESGQGSLFAAVAGDATFQTTEMNRPAYRSPDGDKLASEGFYSGEQVYVVCNATFNTADYKKALRDGKDPMQMMRERCVSIIGFAPSRTMRVDAYPDTVFLDIDDSQEWWWELFFAVQVYVDDPDKFEDRLIEPEGTIDAELCSSYVSSMQWGYFTQRPVESVFQPDWSYWESSPYMDF